MIYALILAVFLLWTPASAMIPLEIGFSDLPLELQLVALCESGGRLNAVGPYGEIGIMQIHPKYHLRTARTLGFNIHDPNGNMAYALYLYNQNGLRDWKSSKHCWYPMLMSILAQIRIIS